MKKEIGFREKIYGEKFCFCENQIKRWILYKENEKRNIKNDYSGIFLKKSIKKMSINVTKFFEIFLMGFFFRKSPEFLFEFHNSDPWKIVYLQF